MIIQGKLIMIIQFIMTIIKKAKSDLNVSRGHFLGLCLRLYEPRHEKTCYLHMRKQRISAFVFTIYYR